MVKKKRGVVIGFSPKGLTSNCPRRSGFKHLLITWRSIERRKSPRQNLGCSKISVPGRPLLPVLRYSISVSLSSQSERLCVVAALCRRTMPHSDG
ncbi:hypothetical protein CDAR_473421 [Caerostris darwini]|uniref:Uncharacterized protein n=1 Tax=Caerostris darwini TaxID=1538125 RepID=A0AAV4RDF2_9ARAC|nr:hypothetical protein CDAR_473421 [Caerostris darwini]